MKHEEEVTLLFNDCRGVLSQDGAAEVQHYIEHGEDEMAFEGLALELIKQDAIPRNFDFSIWERVGRELGLHEESVFDGDFWFKFMSWGKRHTR